MLWKEKNSKEMKFTIDWLIQSTTAIICSQKNKP